MRVIAPSVRLPMGPVLAGAALRRTGRALLWCCRHPGVVVAAAALLGLLWTVGRWGLVPVAIITAGAAGLLCLAVYGWGCRWPASYARWVDRPARSWWRRTWVYRRQWQPAMVTSGLSITAGATELLAVLSRVRATPTVDVVRVRMLPGQTVEDWAKASARLAQTFGVLSVRARPVAGSVHAVELWCRTGDPLTAVVPLQPPIEAPAQLEAVPVGRTEDGTPLLMRVLYSHLLVVGETGSGKGSVIWSLLAGLAPGIAGGWVRVLAIDPKGGMELSGGADLFARFAYGAPVTGKPWQEDMAVLLEQAVSSMQARAARLRGTTRKLTPSTADPLIVVLIDELAALTAYVTDTGLRRRLLAALSLLLSQGRAVGVVVVAASQDGRKEVLTMRDLFPVRVALRTAEDEQADLILGRGARDRGALTDRISPATPGVGYVVLEGSPEPVRVRFSHVTDADIDRLAQRYRPPAPSLSAVPAQKAS